MAEKVIRWTNGTNVKGKITNVAKFCDIGVHFVAYIRLNVPRKYKRQERMFLDSSAKFFSVLFLVVGAVNPMAIGKRQSSQE